MLVVAVLVGATCGYAIGPTPTARIDDAAVGAVFWLTTALIILGLLALNRASESFRRFARASGALTILCGVSFIVLLGVTGGGLSRGPIQESPGPVQALAYVGFFLSVVVGVPAVIVWLVIGLPTYLHALPARPGQGASYTDRAIGYMPDAKPAPTAVTGTPLAFTDELRALVAREFRRQSFGALRLPVVVGALLLLQARVHLVRLAPLDPGWVPDANIVAGLLVVLVVLVFATVQFSIEEIARQRDLRDDRFFRVRGGLYTQTLGTGRGRWSRRVFSGQGDLFVPATRVSWWRIWEWFGLGGIPDQRGITLDFTEHYKYVLAARASNGTMLFHVPGYDPAAVEKASANVGPGTEAARGIVRSALLQPVPLVLLGGFAAVLLMLARGLV